jgi:predicted transcriptional regulator
MEVSLSSDLEAKLARLASREGRDTASLLQEAVERLVNHEEWFLGEVEKGMTAADRGELIDHGEIGRMIQRRYPG